MEQNYRIGHLQVHTPWGNAGGVVKRVEDLELMAHTGVGWIEAGSYTLEPRVGNSPNGEKVYHHDPQTRRTFNSLGMPNKGMDVVEKEIPEMAKVAHAYGKQLIVNIAPVTDDPVEESRELVTRAYEVGADAVLLNAGCPNVVTEDGGRHEILSHNPETLGLVLAGLRDVVEEYNKIFIRTSPVESMDEAKEIMRAIRLSGGVVGAVFTPNTWPGHVPTDEDGNNILEVPGGAGGLSGPDTDVNSRLQTAWARKGLGEVCIDVVSSSGIVSGSELKQRLGCGAVAGCGTTLYYESAEEGWSEATDRLLRQFVDTEN